MAYMTLVSAPVHFGSGFGTRLDNKILYKHEYLSTRVLRGYSSEAGPWYAREARVYNETANIWICDHGVLTHQARPAHLFRRNITHSLIKLLQIVLFCFVNFFVNDECK